MPIMGVQVGRQTDQILSRLAEANNLWVRVGLLNWAAVEPEEGARQWDSAASLAKNLQAYSAQGINVILTVDMTPAWAQKIPGYSCGPVREDKLASFAQFMQDTVEHFGKPPYNVKYWELGNEPDIDPQLVDPDGVIGCWGDASDPYYGGGYYADMLKVVYPAIKAADPQAQVLVGGLLLDCDPTNPPDGKDCQPSKFLEGILRAGGGSDFDLISFHGYPQYSSNPDLDTDRDFPSWSARGGVVMGKVDFLREVMAAYQVDKPLLLTESSLICSEKNTVDCNPPGQAFFQAQADYLVKVYVRDWASNLAGTIWYTFEGPGWRYGSLLDENQDPRPAFQAYQFLLKELAEAKYNKVIDRYPGIDAYQFTAAGKLIWVLWSDNGKPVAISLPEGSTQALDKYGQPLTADQQGMLPVSSPIYIELTR